MERNVMTDTNASTSATKGSDPVAKQRDREQMLRVQRVALLLDVTRKRVYQLIQEGKLEVVRLGPRQTRVLRSSVEQYIEELRRRERIARGDELPNPAPPRRQSHRVQRSRRPPGYTPAVAASAVAAFFAETPTRTAPR